jgi:pilin isopeptide linkage protein
VLVAKVVVADDGLGGVKAAVTYESGDRVFTNAYAYGGTVDASIEATKVVSGWSGADQKWNFTLTEINASGVPIAGRTPKTDSVTGAGRITFALDGLTEGTYYYRLTETGVNDGAFGTGNGWTYSTNALVAKVVVADNGLGGLKATVTYESGDRIFTNAYTYGGTVDASIEATKVVAGWSGDPQTWDFTLTETNASGVPIAGSSLGDETEVDGAGGFSFDLDDLEEGIYYFKVTETGVNDGPFGTGNGWTYSSNVLVAKVVVADDGLGGVKATVTYESGDRIFTNAYAYGGTVDASIEATKVVTGWSGADQKWNFTLTETNASGVPIAGRTPKAGYVNGSGGISFALEDLTEGTYYFRLTETGVNDGPFGTGNGWTYSTNALVAKVVVSDDLNGGVKAVVTYESGDRIFTNAYGYSGTVDASIEATKVVSGLVGHDSRHAAVQVIGDDDLRDKGVR